MNDLSHRLCVAPMMDWTDRHCRFFLRQISRYARLYTEMITTGPLLYGDVARHLDFHPAEHPLALQLGGSDPAALATAAGLGARWGYDEINLNVGCPSERVQTGSFGACLMADPALVAQCVRAMCDAVHVPVTVKHRIGLDAGEDYGFVRDFVGVVGRAGCNVFIVHARNAVLKGLSPKENREVPPLRYEVVHRLKRDFPQYTIVINGGFATWDAIAGELSQVDGTMLGRVAYHDPYILAGADARVFGDAASPRSRVDVVHAMLPYVAAQRAKGVPLHSIVRHMLGLYHGMPNARLWRRMLSDSMKLKDAGPQLLVDALKEVEPELAPAH
ncbi:MAG: tRNA dihydrouridine(20/20a) synthase DusA [Betaproteobacteria bacterium]